MDAIWIDTALGRVHGMAQGAGPLVLGLHGWSQRNGWHTWQPLIAPLAGAGYRVVCVDMPGWGASPPLARGQIHTEDAVEVVLALLDGLEELTATLMGKSWGGGVALQTALDHAERVDKLILTAPAFKRLDRLAEIRHPVLLAWSKDDPVIPIHFASNYVAHVPQVELVTYEEGGHSAAPHNVEDFAPRAIAFLRETTE
jgi:pimeloyl-ACP methyl ester carboxylesterase